MISISSNDLSGNNIKNAFLSHVDTITEENKSTSSSSSSFIKRERKAIAYAVLSQVIWATGVVAIRYGTKCDKFSPNSFSFWRSIFMSVITYIAMRNKNARIINLNEVPSKKWFAIRTFGIYFSFLFLIFSLLYLRTSTTSCLSAAHPFVVMILSVVVLKEIFYMRYLIGLIVCFIGSAMLVLNEKNPSASTLSHDDSHSHSNLMVGMFFISCHILTCGFAVFAQKIMIIDNIDADNQVLYTGLSNCAVSFVVALFEGNFGLNCGVIFFAFLNSIVFYFGITTTNWAMEIMDASKFAPTAYIQTLFVFVFSLVLFGEIFYFSDIIGSFCIVAFHLYNAYNPIKSTGGAVQK